MNYKKTLIMKLLYKKIIARNNTLRSLRALCDANSGAMRCSPEERNAMQILEQCAARPKGAQRRAI